MRRFCSVFRILAVSFLLANGPAYGQTADVVSVEINKRPMVDFSVFAENEIAAGLNLDSEFLVELKGQIGKDGRVIGRTAQFRRGEGDARMVAFVKRLVEAVNESGYFSYLKDILGPEFNLTIRQDKATLYTEMSSDFSNESMAKYRRSSLDLLFNIAQTRSNSEALTQAQKDDFFILKSISISVTGNKLFLKSELPKAFVAEKIRAQSKAKTSEK